ncbi:bifunctional transcriptional activator/DNA repair enzyme AdaA [Lacipirellula limnantheis]|uniref:methylated-DNA--[protein]-cysteine S-methyltransferase n=1 Tax=Lacipirellula limnantheis TaxID=2528024 RepID=A0A517TWF8_9BACT|nr:methylated-DNA--[protein]-cysteine S-methyltransferase [Lacipirellula limnantheis]QDT72707.1 Bifunctional transcriptional activator/DNA repair enzyme Ada [Lacipirellula limnantheis]
MTDATISTTMTFDEQYEAVCRRDPAYVGIFLTAVKTTGIFCRPTCTARTPKRENVEFFATAQESMQHGYRPCKVCKPMEPPSDTPGFIQALIEELHADPALRFRAGDLRSRGIEPAAVRRWFLKHHRMTFNAYQRMLRLNRAYRELAAGGSVAATAFGSGYESLSGFGAGFRQAFGAAPSRAGDAHVIHLQRFSTPIGPMVACATDAGICLCEFTDRRMLEAEFADLLRRLSAVILPAHDNAHLTELERELGEYFAGLRTSFDVSLHTPTTPFRQRVWDELRLIPYAETRSYAEQAERIGKPTAVRAVAAANGQNRVAIVIPCHRVVGADGSLTGYAGGLARKQWLLDHERRHLANGKPPSTPSAATKCGAR